MGGRSWKAWHTHLALSATESRITLTIAVVLVVTIVVGDARAAPVGPVTPGLVSEANSQPAHGAVAAGFALSATESGITLAVARKVEDAAIAAPVGPVAPGVASGTGPQATRRTTCVGLAINTTEARIALAVAEVPNSDRRNEGASAATVQYVARGSARKPPAHPQSSYGGLPGGLALETTEANITHTVAGVPVARCVAAVRPGAQSHARAAPVGRVAAKIIPAESKATRRATAAWERRKG
jgi:hypothetical protein